MEKIDYQLVIKLTFKSGEIEDFITEISDDQKDLFDLVNQTVEEWNATESRTMGFSKMSYLMNDSVVSEELYVLVSEILSIEFTITAI